MDSNATYKINNIPVVYEDEWLLIVYKPAGLLTIPTPKNEPRTLTSILNMQMKEKGASFRLHPCHRLDRETSGLIIYAKGKSMQKKMMAEFKQQRVKKRYLGFVQGLPAKNQDKIQKPVRGLSALSEYKIIQKRKDFTVVEISPLTGRTNQIRIHFKSIGHPLVGEAKFAFRKDYKLKAKRICLHAKSLEFIHPITRQVIKIDSPLPEDLEDFLNTH